MRNRNINISLRVSETEYKFIEEKVKKSKMCRTDYIIACAIGKKISVVEDLKSVIVELKRIGNNLNQAITLAHMGKITECNCTECLESLGKILDVVHEIARKGGGK